MEAALISQRIGITLGHVLLSEARKPIEVHYEAAEGVDMNYVLCSAFYLHMVDLKNLVGMSIDLWIAIVYTVDERGIQNLAFSINHHKIAPCEMKLYPIFSIDHAAKVVKNFFTFSLLPYFDLQDMSRINVDNLSRKYGNVDVWGNTVTINVKAEDFPYDVDYESGVFRGFSKRMLKTMILDVQQALGIQEELKHRIFSVNNDIGIVFIPASTYEASKEVPQGL